MNMQSMDITETSGKSLPESAASGQSEYRLEFPFDYCGARIESLALRRIKTRDYIAIEQEMRAKGVDPEKSGNRERTAYVLSRAAGQPVEMILEMDAVDFLGLEQAWGASFF